MNRRQRRAQLLMEWDHDEWHVTKFAAPRDVFPDPVVDPLPDPEGRAAGRRRAAQVRLELDRYLRTVGRR